MDHLHSPRTPARETAFAKELVFRRIAEASLRLEIKAREALRRQTADLFDEAVFGHFASMLRPAISDSYRQLQSSVWDACGTLEQLPSETTFRRRIARGRKLATDALTKRACGRR
ncbi:hypothetical protein ACC691_26400 [Rhizobium johnstonii]|uniref:hypothetical protein n=1 Tax=Rhizobium johnstonii TaxID=3019933 RepID=UPI003F9B5F79